RPPLALTSSRQICSAVSTCLPIGATPPVSAMLMPTRIGSAALAAFGEISAPAISSAESPRAGPTRLKAHMFSSLHAASPGALDGPRAEEQRSAEYAIRLPQARDALRCVSKHEARPDPGRPPPSRRRSAGKAACAAPPQDEGGTWCVVTGAVALPQPRAQTCSTLQVRNEPLRVAAADLLHLLVAKAELLQPRDLVEREIGIVRAVGDLRDRNELHQRRHRRRRGRVGGVVMKPLELAFDP